MAFQKGHPPYNKKKVSDDVIEETIESASYEDEIIPKAPPTPKPEKQEVVIPQLPVDESPDFGGVYGWNMAELELLDFNLTKAPKPPKCVQEWCRRHDLVYRWLSYPRVKEAGMRGYIALSMTPELRKKVKAGDCPATVDIDVSNKLVWREDAFLGVMPKKLYDLLLKGKRQRILDQNKIARLGPSGLRDMAERAGGKIVEYTVEETARQGL